MDSLDKKVFEMFSGQLTFWNIYWVRTALLMMKKK